MRGPREIKMGLPAKANASAHNHMKKSLAWSLTLLAAVEFDNKPLRGICHNFSAINPHGIHESTGGQCEGVGVAGNGIAADVG
jgi:hypothetical protein